MTKEVLTITKLEIKLVRIMQIVLTLLILLGCCAAR